VDGLEVLVAEAGMRDGGHGQGLLADREAPEVGNPVLVTTTTPSYEEAVRLTPGG